MSPGPEPPVRRSHVLIALHWIMLLLLAAAYAAIELRELFPRGSDPRDALKTLHFTLGLTVLALVVVRIALRLRERRAGARQETEGWQRFPPALVHVGLYAVMILAPIAGWLTLSAQGKPIPFFGLELPPLIAEGALPGDAVEDWHRTIGTIGYWLIGIHAAAALFHHYVLRDRILLAMLPFRASPKPGA